MIVGVGTDIVTVDRIARFHARHGGRGLSRLFTSEELAYCLQLARSAPSLAARFAAKEAFFKALGTGWGRGGRWVDVQLEREASGRPRLVVRDRAAERARERGVTRLHVSISHTSRFATAIVLLEG